MAELDIHSGACGPFIMTGAAGYRQVQTPKGRLFAFDTEGQHVLTCGLDGGLIYKVRAIGGKLSPGFLGKLIFNLFHTG